MMQSSELPEQMIQQIQSLLTSKQAARTTFVSKSWHAAFKTRPNLDFDQADFLRIDDDGTHEIVPFSAYVLNTIARHAESNLKIHSFTICVSWPWCDFHPLLRRALESGTTRLSLSVQSKSWNFHVPKEELQYENLVSLTLKGAVIYELDQVTCSRLESLCLEKVGIKSLFPRLISACPLIQNLSLSRLRVYDTRGRLVDFDTSFLRDLSSSFPVLKDLTLRMVSPNLGDEGDMLISSRSLERLEIELLRGSGKQGIRFDLPSIRKLTFEGPVGIPLLSLRSNLCVDENISTATSNHLNQVRAHITFY